MKDRPILFSAPMVLAILEGRKTMTRRVVTDKREWVANALPSVRRFAPSREGWFTMATGESNRIVHCGHEMDGGHIGSICCPYGAPGDRLYVKEASWIWCDKVPNGNTKTGRDKFRYVPVGQHVVHCAGNTNPTALIDDNPRHQWRWKAARFMPRWASRITLEVTAVRVERVQDISIEDAIAEGVLTVRNWKTPTGARGNFADLWHSINGKRHGCAWSDNPWVWVVSFKRVAQ